MVLKCGEKAGKIGKGSGEEVQGCASGRDGLFAQERRERGGGR